MVREMKDSGIEWIGKIPKEWKTLPLGNCFSERNEKVSDKEWEPLSVTKKGIFKQLENVAKSDAHDSRKKVCKGDFIINSRSDRKQSCGLSDFDGSVSLINIVLKNIFYNKEYTKYLLKNVGFAEEFYRWGSGIVADLWSTKYSKMKKIILPVPTLEEQGKIVNYLDKKVSDIDLIIEKTKITIEDYKKYKQSIITETVTKGLNPNVEMKDSRIEWIGKIPKHWGIIKIKYTSFLKGRIGWQGLKASEFLTEGPYLITGKDFYKGKIEWNNCFHISEERFKEAPDIHVKENDLLITKDGTIGKLALIKDCPDKVSLNSGVLLIRNTKKYKYINEYLYYILSSNQFILWYELSQNGNSTIKHLYQEQFYNFTYSYPSLNEQKQIAEYLDKKTSEIDTLIAKKEALIKELEEYKKSLIYECVTGKKKLSNMGENYGC